MLIPRHSLITHQFFNIPIENKQLINNKKFKWK